MATSSSSFTGGPEKPLLRGVSHQVSFFVAAIATAWLVHVARPGAQVWTSLVFGASLVSLFGVSALYHRIHWQPAARARMRRLDHCAIFVLIAGGYTPLLVLVPRADGGHAGLAVLWGGAAIGVVKSLAWAHAPKWLTAVLCLALGWVGVGEVAARVGFLGWGVIAPLVASGLIYSLGAVVYALKRPDPAPRVFGYHEVFHALVVVASASLFTYVALLLRAT